MSSASNCEAPDPGRFLSLELSESDIESDELIDPVTSSQSSKYERSFKREAVEDIAPLSKRRKTNTKINSFVFDLR